MKQKVTKFQFRPLQQIQMLEIIFNSMNNNNNVKKKKRKEKRKKEMS